MRQTDKSLFGLFFGPFELFLCSKELVAAALGPLASALGQEIALTQHKSEIYMIKQDIRIYIFCLLPAKRLD